MSRQDPSKQRGSKILGSIQGPTSIQVARVYYDAAVGRRLNEHNKLYVLHAPSRAAPAVLSINPTLLSQHTAYVRSSLSLCRSLHGEYGDIG
jgi:hypothetical protein